MTELLDFLQQYQVGDFIEGTVIQHQQFGVFLDLNVPPILGLVRIVSFKNQGPMSPELLPRIGTKVRGIITDFYANDHQVNISLKPIDFEKFRRKRGGF